MLRQAVRMLALLAVVCACALPAFAQAERMAREALVLTDERGDHEGACRIYAQMEERGLHTAATRGNWGVALVRAGRCAEAVEQLMRSIEDGPDTPPANLQRALTIALIGSGQPDDAMVLVRSVLFMTTDDALTRATLGAAADMLAEQAKGAENEEAAAVLSGYAAEIRDALRDEPETPAEPRTRNRAPRPRTGTVEAAVALARDGSYDEAFALFAQLDAAAKLDGKGVGDWGIALLWAERYEEALAKLTLAVNKVPQPPADYLVRAYVSAVAGSGDLDRAYELAVKHLVPKMADQATRTDLLAIAERLDEAARLAGLDGDAERAAELRERASALRPAGFVPARTRADEAVELAREAQATEDPVQRAELFRQALGVFEDLDAANQLDWKSLADWGIVLLWTETQEGGESAAAVLRRAEAEAPAPTPTYILTALASAMAASGDLDGAWELAQDRLVPSLTDPDVAKALRALAFSFFDAGTKSADAAHAAGDAAGVAEGLAQVDRALALDPENARYAAGRARVLIWRGDVTADATAAADYQEAVGILAGLEVAGPDDIAVLLDLGEAHEALERRERAAGSPEAAQAERDRALAAFQAALDLVPDSQAARNGVIRVADLYNQEGVALATEAEAMPADAPERANAFARAIGLIGRAIDLAPEVGRFAADLGIVYNWMGAYEQAVDQLSKALELYPDIQLPYTADALPLYAHVYSAYAVALAGRSEQIATQPAVTPEEADAARGMREESLRIVAALERSTPRLEGLADLTVSPARRIAAEGTALARQAADAAAAGAPDPEKEQAALAAFEEALALAPETWQVCADVGIGLNWLARDDKDAARRNARFTEALGRLEFALRTAPEPKPLYLVDGVVRSLIGLGRLNEALEFVEAYMKQSPESREALVAARDAVLQAATDAALARWETEDHRVILAELRALHARVPDSAQLMLDLGVLVHSDLTERGDAAPSEWLEARRLLETAVEALENAEPAKKAPDYALAALAGVYVNTGEWELALETTGRLEAQNPDHPEVRNGYEAVAARVGAAGMDLIRNGQANRGLAELNRALEIAPWYWKARADVGIASLWQGDGEAAVALLETAAESAGDEAPVYVLRSLGDAYVSLGRYADARAAYERALAADPADIATQRAFADLPRGIGQHALEGAWNGDLDAARARAEAACAQCPDDPWVWIDAGVIASWDHRSEEAIAVLTEWMPKLPLAPLLGYVALGDAYLDLGRAEEAANVWLRLPADYHELASATGVRERAATRLARFAGDLTSDLTQWDRAEAIYRAAAEIAPRDPRILADLGVLLMRQERYAEAEHVLHLARTMAEAPNSYVTRTLGDVLALSNDTDGAIAYYEEALRIDDTDWSSAVGMARALAWDGRTEEALTALDARLAVKPDEVALIAGRAYVLALANRLDEALREYDKALALRPGDASLMVGKAQALNWAGKHDAAYSILQRILREDPNNADALIQTIAAAKDSNRPEAAVDALEKLEGRYPDSPALEEYEWVLRPYRDPSVTVYTTPAWDTDYVMRMTSGAIARWPITPEFRVEAETGFRWFREPNVTGTDWRFLRFGADWQVGHRLRLSGWVQDNRIENLGAWRPLTYQVRADYRANDKWDLRAYYKHDVLDATRAMLDRTTMDELGLGVTYRENSRTRWTLDAALIDVSDGNQRNVLSASWRRRVHRDGNRWGDFSIEGRRMTNSLQSARYWSPAEYDQLMARYEIGEDDFEDGLWWSVGAGVGLSYESGAGYGVPFSLSASLRKRVGDDGLLELSAGLSTAGTERSSPGSRRYIGTWVYLGYTHYF